LDTQWKNLIISNYLYVGPHLKKDNDVECANDGAIHCKKENNKNMVAINYYFNAS
jgi:hypothetical protein